MYCSVLLNYFCLIMAMGVDTHSCMLANHILKLGPDDDLDEVKTCRPCKLNN